MGVAGVILIDNVPTVKHGNCTVPKIFYHTHIPFVKYVRRWNTENISALLHGVLRRNQCTASNRCLYHESAHAQTGQHAVPQRKICRCRRSSRQKLRQDQAVLGDFIFQVYMGFRIRHVQPAAHQGNAGLVRLQSTQIGGDVNTGGIARPAQSPSAPDHDKWFSPPVNCTPPDCEFPQ